MTLFFKCTPEKKILGGEKTMKVTNVPLTNVENTRLPWAKKKKMKNFSPYVWGGGRIFFHCIMEHIKSIFHCFRKRLFNIVIFFFRNVFAFFGNFENHHCKNQFAIKMLNFFLHFSVFLRSKTHHEIRKKKTKESFFSVLWMV